MRNKQILRFVAGAALLALCLMAAQWSRHVVDPRGDAKATAKPASSQKPNAPLMSSPFPARLAKTGGGLAQPALLPMSPTGAPRLFTYTTGKVLHQDGATLFPVQLNMDDVFASALNGRLDLTAPDGSPVSLAFDKHVEHDNKNWTWIGREVGGDASRNAIITFGPDLTIGSLPSINGNQLKLVTVAGQTYISSTPLALLHQGTNPAGDIVTPPTVAADAFSAGVTSQGSVVTSADASSSAKGPIVDVLIAYTSGYRFAHGGTTNSAVTTINYLIDVANYALYDSRVTGQYRLVGTMEVNYPDTGTNSQALTDVQSNSPASPLAAVHAAREKYGADIVSIMRVFNSAQEDCGVAYIMDGNHNPDFAYSEVSDGEYQVSPGYYRYCTEVTLAHEMGHNLGAAHNTQIDPTGGIFPYSHGYRDDAANFYDIMAYGLDGQTQFEIYSTPLLGNCYNQLCGNAASADVARTFQQTMPIAAAYRAAVFNTTDDGLRGQITLAVTGRCLDLPNDDTTDGMRVQMWDCNGLHQQQWEFERGNGAIVAENTGSALDVVNEQTNDGAPIQTWSQNLNPNQVWFFNNAALVTADNKVLDAVNMGTGNGTLLQVWDDLGGSNQRWRYDPVTAEITSASGRCLDIKNFGLADDTPVQLWDCNGTTNQLWRLQNNGLMISDTGLCLQVTGTASGDGSGVSVAACNGSPQQLWRLRGEIRGKQSDKCLDDPSGGLANGSHLQIWTCLGNSHQQWLY